MVRLVTTNCFYSDDDGKNYCAIDTNTLDNLKVSTYFNFEEYVTFVQKDDLKNTLYSLNLISKTHLSNEKFLIYINDNEYSICFDHKTIYSLKIEKQFKLNDIIKSVLITKNLIMLLSAGDINKVYFIIDSQYEELYKNILIENLKNDKGEHTVEKLGNLQHLIKELPELETKRTFLFKYITLGVLIFVSIYLTFDGLNRFSKRFFPINNNSVIVSQIKFQNTQLIQNQIKLKELEKNSLCGCKDIK
jgi:hypothetical protein